MAASLIWQPPSVRTFGPHMAASLIYGSNPHTAASLTRQQASQGSNPHISDIALLTWGVHPNPGT